MSAAEFWPGWLLQSLALALASAALWARVSPAISIESFLLGISQSFGTGLFSFFLLREVRRRPAPLTLLFVQVLVGLSVLFFGPSTGQLSIPATLPLAGAALVALVLLWGGSWFTLLWGLMFSYASVVMTWHAVDGFELIAKPDRFAMVTSHGLWTGLGHCALLGTWLDLSALSKPRSQPKFPVKTQPECSDQLDTEKPVR